MELEDDAGEGRVPWSWNCSQGRSGEVEDQLEDVNNQQHVSSGLEAAYPDEHKANESASAD